MAKAFVIHERAKGHEEDCWPPGDISRIPVGSFAECVECGAVFVLKDIGYAVGWYKLQWYNFLERKRFARQVGTSS